VHDLVATSAESIAESGVHSADDVRGKPRRLFVTAMNWLRRIGRSGNFCNQNVYYHPRVAEVNRRACEDAAARF
jgi:hypothetical protein